MEFVVYKLNLCLMAGFMIAPPSTQKKHYDTQQNVSVTQGQGVLDKSFRTKAHPAMFHTTYSSCCSPPPP